MRTPIHGGTLVAVVGIDRSGKTTQGAALAQYFSAKGLLNTLCREPDAGKSPVPECIDHCLDAWWENHVNYLTRSAAPTLAMNGIVILERPYSALVWQDLYQSFRGPDSNCLHPEIQIVLTVPVPFAHSSGSKSPRVGAAHAHARVGAPSEACDFFSEFTDTNEDAVVIDGTGSIAEVHKVVRRKVLEAAVAKIARERGMDATAVNDIIGMLDNPEEVWGLWPELDEILTPGNPRQNGGITYPDATMLDPKVIPLPS